MSHQDVPNDANRLFCDICECRETHGKSNSFSVNASSSHERQVDVKMIADCPTGSLEMTLKK